MIDHLGFTVRDFAKSFAFYKAAIEPLGLGFAALGENWAMIGKNKVGQGGMGQIWFGIDGHEATSPIHFAFRAESREAVDAFYLEALKAGGRDNGAPGLRPQYHTAYYAAFVIDPDGHNVEAVCHGPG